MQNGTITQCGGVFYDSGGASGNYSSNENFVLTICPEDAGDLIQLDFFEFNTQLNADTLYIYDGQDTSAPLIGEYDGGAANSPGVVMASNASGCLTIQYISDAAASTTGWAANIGCASPCQTITASIDNTNPAPDGSGNVVINNGDSVDFTGSATFSEDGTGATYEWDFNDGNNDTGLNVTNTFNTPGTYTVTLTVTDPNPMGCSDTATITVQVLGPYLQIDQTTYTVPELIEDVLVNSPCAGVSNINFSTGTNFSSTNGIGYFFGNGQDFPFTDGIVLTSGNAASAGGPETGTLSDGSNAWPGDLDLENAIPGLNAGDTNNATFIEFDFVPLANTISFNFVFASEEYGGFQCSFTDAFAFLLTDTNTGVTTNLAIVPGTTDPISVLNVRDNAYNGGCPSVNEEFFAAYYGNPGGLPEINSPTDFRGHTVSMAAQGTVIPNTTYSIKLVIADDGDTLYDAAVFLEAGSFDLGGELGDDITIEASTALCLGETIVLDTQVPTATHIWYLNGEVINGETQSTLDVTIPGEYTAEIVFSGDCTASDSIIVEFIPNPTVEAVQNLVICNAPGNVFNLTDNDALVLGSQTPEDFEISYYTSQADADEGDNAIDAATAVNYAGSNGETIYVRIEDVITQLCFDTSSFQLVITDNPTISTVPDLEVCDDDSNDGFEEFDLTVQDLGILGTQLPADFVVTYYANFADADAGNNALVSPYTNIVNPQPIYVRVESANDETCYAASPSPLFNLVVNWKAIANAVPDMEVCDDDTDGFASFDIFSQTSGVLGGQDAGLFTVTYHDNPTDAGTGANALGNPYTNTVANQQTIYVRIEEDANPVCYGTTQFEIIVNPLPTITPVTPLEVCDDDADGFAEFTLEDKNAEILNGQTDVVVSYYASQVDADGMSNALVSPYTNTVAFFQTVVVGLENTATGCYTTTTMDLVVNPLPIPVAPPVYEVCDDDNDCFAIFDLSAVPGQVLGAQTGMTVTIHETPSDATTGANPIADISNYANISACMQTLHVRLEDDVTGCSATTTLELIVNPIPVFGAITDYELCDDNNPGDLEEAFDLTTKDVEIANGQNVTVSYYETQTDAENLTNPIIGLYTSTSTVVYVNLSNNVTGCSSVGTFNIVVNPLPLLVDPTPLEVCDDNVADGFTAIDLSIKNNEIQGGNPNYSITYYLNQADADAGINPLSIPYTNISNPQTIIVVGQDINTGCTNSTTLELVVEQAPVAFVPTPLEYCDADNDGFGVFELSDADNEITGGQAGLTVTYHETMSDADNNVNALASNYTNIVAYTQTIYVRVESATIATDCATIVELQLIVNDTPPIVDPTPLEVCDDDTDGIAIFDLTSKADEILDGLDPTQYIISYYETQANAEAPMLPILTPGAYTNLVPFVTQTIWIRVDDNVNGCHSITTLELIVNELPVLVQPTPITLCNDNDLPGEDVSPIMLEEFTLEDASDEILNGQTGISLSFYETQADADLGTNPIFSPYVNIANAQTIYVRAVNDVTGCVSTITLDLRVEPLPSPATPLPIEVCDEDNDGIASFELEDRTIDIINGELDVVVTYHETLADAENGLNALVSPYDNVSPWQQIVYIRVENTVTGCYNATETLELIVLPSPVLPLSDELDPLEVCDDDDNGIYQFDLTDMDATLLGTQDPVDFILTYHLTQADAETGANPIINTTNYTSGNGVIYVRLVSVANGCVSTTSFEIIVHLPPEPVQPTPLEECDDDYYDDADELFAFDLTVKDNEIIDGNASWVVTYYETAADAQADTNAIPDPTNYTNTSVDGNPANPQTLHVRVTDTDTDCYAFVTLTIRVLPNPTPSQDPADLELCDDNNSGDEQEEFDLTVNEAYIINGEAGVTATYHETQEDADAGTNAIATPDAYINTATPVQTIYVRVTNDVTGCYTIVTFDTIVHPLPVATAMPSFIACELNTDDVYDFDLTSQDEAVLNGQDPSIFEVTYHLTQADADLAENALQSPYTNISDPQTIYVNITNTITGCQITTVTIDLEVHEAAQANQDLPVFEECDDNVETDGDPSNDSVQFDLTTQDALVLMGQDPASYTVTYYATLEDADGFVNPLPTLYENVVNPQTIYVRVDNDTMIDDGTGNMVDSSACYEVAELVLQVNPLPVFDLDDEYLFCINTNGTEVVDQAVMETGLSETEYSFVWTDETGVVVGTGSSYAPVTGGNHSVTVTNIATGCNWSDTALVNISEPPVVTASVTTLAFANNHVIEATAEVLTGGANNIAVYEFSLDDGPWQESGTFIDVIPGEHIVYARDLNGCGIGQATVIVMDYPLYFTPNGDGYHDTWNIVGISNQPNAKIYIFDRYGKLLKQLSPTGEGWNGTYNGEHLPSSDYWFTVEYDEPSTNERKQFKAHFTLKR
ncbi:choice-of-anchor L domain-containing protein [Pontimicrobium sp. IMCC45349]|uniref:choice-of-anchor L domain-containing protein n=1 Tax=Pontimicrobium sp. IMCC45349 TaxID=3391574 RepID=UPI0039A330CC